MKYEEYRYCARKHLSACQMLFDAYTNEKKEHSPVQDKNVWLELYYLSGYIVEGLVVYSVYKLYGWPENDDIQKAYNKDFTKETGLDFYYTRKDRETGEFVYPDRTRESLSLQGHHFQDIIKNLLHKKPSIKDIPYFDKEVIIRDDVKELLNAWNASLRYCHRGLKPELPRLNKDIIQELINTCEEIYKNIYKI